MSDMSLNRLKWLTALKQMVETCLVNFSKHVGFYDLRTAEGERDPKDNQVEPLPRRHSGESNTQPLTLQPDA